MRLCVADIVLCRGTPGRSIHSGWGGGGGGGGFWQVFRTIYFVFDDQQVDDYYLAGSYLAGLQ